MFLDYIFPKSCVGCQRIGRVLCESCRNDLKPTVVDVCPYCFYSSPQGKTHERCKESKGLDGSVSVVQYNGVAKKIIKSIKYRFAYDVYRQITENIPHHWWRSELYKDFSVTETVVQPIPLHVSRIKSRGFNQSELVAAHFSKITNLRTITALKRIINTQPQAKLPTREERKQNIRGAFVVTNQDQVDGKTVILIDDIFTSASTAKEAARVLKSKGARNVFLYTFAHGS